MLITSTQSLSDLLKDRIVNKHPFVHCKLVQRTYEMCLGRLLNRFCDILVQTYLQHLVRAGLNAGRHVTGIKRQLLDLSEIVDRVSVQHKASHRNQREVFMGPHLKDTEPVIQMDTPTSHSVL